MGQILHRSAKTTVAIRRAIQHSQESLRTPSRRHGINPKTVAKWRKRSSTADHRTDPTVPKSTVLSIEQEAVIVAFRKHTLLLLDDCLYALQATIPQLTRSSLHRCLERHGISRLPEGCEQSPHAPYGREYPEPREPGNAKSSAFGRNLFREGADIGSWVLRFSNRNISLQATSNFWLHN